MKTVARVLGGTIDNLEERIQNAIENHSTLYLDSISVSSNGKDEDGGEYYMVILIFKHHKY